MRGTKPSCSWRASEEGRADPVEAGELARLLLQHQVPIAILNACQSGMQVGDRETSLGSQLLGGGIQTVLAMGYSVTVTAAELLMQRLYEQLFGGAELGDAICAGRLALYNRKGRRGSYNQVVDLEDWLLPVVYENQPQQLRTKDFTPAEEKAFYERQAAALPRAQGGVRVCRPRPRHPQHRAQAARANATCCSCTAWAARAKPRCCTTWGTGGRPRGWSTRSSTSATTRRRGRGSRSWTPSPASCWARSTTCAASSRSAPPPSRASCPSGCAPAGRRASATC